MVTGSTPTSLVATSRGPSTTVACLELEFTYLVSTTPVKWRAQTLVSAAVLLLAATVVAVADVLLTGSA